MMVYDMQYLFDIIIYGPEEVHGELSEVYRYKGKLFIKPKSIPVNGFLGYQMQRFVISPGKARWLINHVDKITEDSQSELEFRFWEAIGDMHDVQSRARGKKRRGGYARKDRRTAA
jgi:hypothetical protein